MVLRSIWYTLLFPILLIAAAATKYHISTLANYYMISDGTEKDGDLVRTIRSPCPPFDSVLTTELKVGPANFTITSIVGKAGLHINTNGDAGLGKQLVWTKAPFESWFVERTPKGPPYRVSVLLPGAAYWVYNDITRTIDIGTDPSFDWNFVEVA